MRERTSALATGVSDAAGEAASVEGLLKLIGEEVCILAARWPQDLSHTGDIDCAVRRLDQRWPLRLTSDWRLIHHRNYDINSWMWTIEHDGELFALDCIDDPRGIGRYKFPTALVRCADGPLPAPAVRAAYLTIKRLRKGIQRDDEWRAIGDLARQNRSGYGTVLQSLLGERCAAELLETVIATRVPGERLRLQALSLLWMRRFRNPELAVQAMWKGSLRWVTRLTHPTGLMVLLAGADGSGKSTLATRLPAVCEGGVVFLRHKHFHWRPGLLPSLGALVGSPPGDPAKPHERPPHRPLTSALVIAYYWLDFFLGGLVLAPFKARSGLIIVERGWWDVCVDPRRYRSSAPPWLLKALGHLLMQPDLVMVLEAAPDVLLTRKTEIARDELERQTREWHDVIPRRVRRVYIDASAPAEEVLAAAREAVLSVLSDRAARRIGPGWTDLPTRSSPRWVLPRGPRKTARSALAIYQPVTVRARLGWEAGRALATTGLMRLLPRGEAPSEAARATLAPHVPPRSTYSVMRANHPARSLALIVRSDGRPHAFAKVAYDEEGANALEAEAENIERYGGLLEPPVRAPRIIGREAGLLLLEPVRWIPRMRPWVLPAEVARGLGRAFARTSDEAEGRGFAHGDCAPWNLLRTQDGWVLVDWEESRSDAPVFYDLFHFLVQAHVLLGRPSRSQLTGHVPGPPWVRAAIEAYAAGAGEPEASWRLHFCEYLRASKERLDPSDPAQARALAARSRLLRAAEVYA